MDTGDPALEEPHRYRIEAIRRQYPKLVQLGSHTGPINHAELRPDDARLVTASDHGTALVWDLATGERLTPPLRHGSNVVQVIFSPDGRCLATGTTNGDGTARIWELRRNDWPVRDLVLLAEVMAGGRMDTAGKLEPLALAEWREMWLELKSRQPDAFTTSTEQAAAWHSRQVEAAVRGGQWSAGRVHLARRASDR